MTQLTIFDAIESERRAVDGITLAADNRASLVLEARQIAIEHCRRFGTVTADDVVAGMMRRGYGPHVMQNAMGGVFRDRQFEFTGQYVKSTRIWAKSNLLRVWRLK